MSQEALTLLWEVCQNAGTGMSVVLSVVVFALWRERKENVDYLRTTEKNNLELLVKLTGLLEKNEDAVAEHHGKLTNIIVEHDSRLTKVRDEIIKLTVEKLDNIQSRLDRR